MKRREGEAREGGEIRARKARGCPTQRSERKSERQREQKAERGVEQDNV